jgi:hypothetical protein
LVGAAAAGAVVSVAAGGTGVGVSAAPQAVNSIERTTRATIDKAMLFILFMVFPPSRMVLAAASEPTFEPVG